VINPVVLVVQVAASMKSRRRPPLVMGVGVFCFSVITVFYSAYAYAAGYGRADCDIITKCLGSGGVVTTVRLALSASLIVTHPMYLNVASKIFETALLGEEPREPSMAYVIRARLIRAGEVALTCGVAALVPNLSVFTSLVGATGLTFIGFILPSFMWIVLMKGEPDRLTRIRVYAISGIILAAGLVAMIFGAKAGIQDLIKSV
jgi:hypothetical protein